MWSNVHRFASYWFAKYFLHGKFRNEFLPSNLDIHYNIVSQHACKSGMMIRQRHFLRSLDCFVPLLCPRFYTETCFQIPSSFRANTALQEFQCGSLWRIAEPGKLPGPTYLWRARANIIEGLGDTCTCTELQVNLCCSCYQTGKNVMCQERQHTHCDCHSKCKKQHLKACKVSLYRVIGATQVVCLVST